MVADRFFFLRENGKMITDKVVNIAVIQLAVINDFRLVLLVCSTQECPKLIFGRLILLFWAMIRTLQTQKERAQRSFSSDSYYFLLLKKYIIKVRMKGRTNTCYLCL